MVVRVLAFASLRETLGEGHAVLELSPGARVSDAWAALARTYAPLGALEASTRIALNGRLADPGDALADGDELALLPPVGGG